jgi:RNA polymerase sigma-54 factor
MEIIKKLDPKPGRKYSSEEAQPVVPEVTIEKVGDDYIIRFEDDGLPHLRINRTYRQMMESKDSSKRLAITSGAVPVGGRFVEKHRAPPADDLSSV